MLIEFMDQSNSPVFVQTNKITYLTVPYCNYKKIPLVEIHFDNPLAKVVVKGILKEVQEKINNGNEGC